MARREIEGRFAFREGFVSGVSEGTYIILCGAENGRGDWSAPLPNTVELQLCQVLTANPIRRSWADLLPFGTSPTQNRPRKPRQNGHVKWLHDRGYYTVGDICKAAGIPDSTFRDWEGVHFPELPRVRGLRAVRKDQYAELTAVCRQVKGK